MKKIFSFMALILILSLFSVLSVAADTSDLPDWYPEDINDFQKFHNSKAPRVVDNADIFTSDQETVIETRLSEIRKELNKDIVVFTDNSTYGFSHERYAEDFYDYNGYGCGDEYEGVCLMVCMDSDDRGWWVCCTGSETIDLYTEDYANQLDDVLYEYMSNGEYYTGVSDWIENFRTLYIKGRPFAPDWYPDDTANFKHTHNESAPRVVDEANLLSDNERTKLEQRAKALADEFGTDIVIHTAVDPVGFTRESYADDFYFYNGYGFGDNYSGYLLTLYQYDRYYVDYTLSEYGNEKNKLTGTNLRRMKSKLKDALGISKSYEACSEWLTQMDYLLSTGRVPRKASHWVLFGIASLIVGLIFGKISLSSAKRKMHTVARQLNANSYVVSQSVSVIKKGDTLMDTKISEIYSPRSRGRSSSSYGSSSRKSSYKRSHKGSSGTRHSGSGRKF